MKLKTSLIVTFGIGVAYAIVVAVLSAYHVLDFTSSVLMILVMISILVGYQIAVRPGGRFAPDERMKRMDARATVWSWILTLYGASILFFMDTFHLYSLTYSQLPFILVLFMPCSKLLTRLILSRLPDVSE